MGTLEHFPGSANDNQKPTPAELYAKRLNESEAVDMMPLTLGTLPVILPALAKKFSVYAIVGESTDVFLQKMSFGGLETPELISIINERMSGLARLSKEQQLAAEEYRDLAVAIDVLLERFFTGSA
ncbi:hypothetical protein K2Q16_03145 [Patescibacteria group bacterium]|nr:hypothetical protein [Patescibacteria group bacterium]